MKRYIILLFLTIFTLLSANTNQVLAQDYLKNFYAYEVKNVNVREFNVILKNSIEDYKDSDNWVVLKGVENSYTYTGKDYTYFVKTYPANQNTNIFLVANEKYNVQDNDVTQYLKKGGYKYKKLEDKAAFEEYQYDFYNLARSQKLGNFYISPDLVKPLKVGISAVSNKLSKYTKKTPAQAYEVDSAPINLTCIDTTGYYDNNAHITIIRREYRLKEKTNKYIHAFEYILTNKNTDTATVTVTSEQHVNLVDVTTKTMENMDKVDYVDMTCSFPPVVIGTLGISLLGSIPNWVRWAKLTKEATRYTHAFPENYRVRSQGYMRVLVLKSKENPQPLNFAVKYPKQTYNISF